MKIKEAFVKDRTYFNDRTGREILRGDKVKGLFHHGYEVIGTCDYSAELAAWGIRWERGNVEEFTAFCQCCNVDWEVDNDN